MMTLAPSLALAGNSDDLNRMASKQKEPDADRTLLVLVTLDGNENLHGFFIDPELENRFEARGWKIEGRGIEEVQQEHLEAADAVVLLQEPYGVNVKGVQALRDLAPKLDRYLKDGGGVFVIFDDRYFQVFAPVNELLKPYGASIVREAVIDSNAENVSLLENDDGVTVFKTRNLHPDHPATAGIASMAFPQTEGGKDSYPLVLSPEWIPLIRAEKSAKSEDVWAVEHQESYEAEPVLAAAREVGGGRLVLFGSHSSLSFLHGSHARWDDGYFLKQGMAAFFLQALDWLEKAPSVAKGGMPPLKGNPSPATELKPVPVDQQSPAVDWKKGVIVLLDQEPASLEDWVEALAGKLDWIALVLPDTVLPEEKDYARWKALCQKTSRSDFLIIPGGKVLDSFRNPVAVLNPDTWPVRRKMRAINHIAREIGGHPVLLSPDANPWPVENIGGFQGLALAEYEKGELRRVNLETFRALQAEDWFLVPQVVFSETDPKTLASTMEQRGYRTLVPSSELKDVPLKFPFLFHNERDIVVSRGPEIRQAALTGPSLVNDPWEGLYYLWRGPDDHAVYAMDLKDIPEKSEIRVYRNKLLWRRYFPSVKEWQHRFEFASTESLHSYWLEIWKGGELEAISSASRSRNFYYWAHGGGDRMNLYHSIMREDPAGNLIAHGKRLTGYGSLLFNLGWGDTIAISPSKSLRETHPAGHEWGNPSGGIQYLRVAPRVRFQGMEEYVISKPRRMGYAMVSEEMAVLHEILDRKEVTIDGIRTVQPAELLKSEITYTIPVWAPSGPISFVAEMTITPLKDLDLGGDPAIQIMEFAGRLAGSFLRLTTEDDRGETVSGALFNRNSRRGDHTGRWFLIHPDPLGAVLFAPLDEHSYSLTAAATSKGPRVSFLIHPKKSIWHKNEPVRVRFAFALMSGKEDDVDGLAVNVIESWQGKNSKIQLEKGQLDSFSGCVKLSSENGIVAGSIDSAKGQLPLACEIRTGVSERVPAYGKSLVSRENAAQWVPLGQESESVYLTVPATRRGPIPLRAGKLVDSSNPEFQIDVKDLSADRLEIWVHNPSEDEQAGAVRLSKLIPGNAGADQVSLNPGEERLVTFELNEPKIAAPLSVKVP